VAQRGFVGIAERVVPGADVVPRPRLVRRQLELDGPAIEQCGHALDVGKSLFADLSPAWELEGHQRDKV